MLVEMEIDCKEVFTWIIFYESSQLIEQSTFDFLNEDFCNYDGTHRLQTLKKRITNTLTN